MDPLSYIFSLEQFGIKLGLENMRAIVAALGNPHRACPSIHIGGTNGKGSVTAMIDTALRLAGHRAGRYTSPHLIDISERFAIDGRPADRAALESAAAVVVDAIERLRAGGVLEVHPTYFEATTALAFELFRRERVEVATYEVGLGGRLDATNVLSPEVTAITSIAFDHEQYLGRTLAGIAGEKAGIVKPGVPVVVGPLPDEALDTIAARAAHVGAPLVHALDGVEAAVVNDRQNRVRLRTPDSDYGEIALGLRGAHQVSNAIVAVRVLELAAARGIAVATGAIKQALATVWWPGRLDVRRFDDGREAILDAAHNAEGAEALARALDVMGARPLPLVFGAMRDKDAQAMFEALLPAASLLVVTEAATPRAAPAEALAAEARAIDPAIEIVVEPSIASALRLAWSRAPRIAIAGSIFLLGDVYKEFGGLPVAP